MNTITPFTEENNKYILDAINDKIRIGDEYDCIADALKDRYPDTSIKILQSYVGEVFRLNCVCKYNELFSDSDGREIWTH